MIKLGKIFYVKFNRVIHLADTYKSTFCAKLMPEVYINISKLSSVDNIICITCVDTLKNKFDSSN